MRMKYVKNFSCSKSSQEERQVLVYRRFELIMSNKKVSTTWVSCVRNSHSPPSLSEQLQKESAFPQGSMEITANFFQRSPCRHPPQVFDEFQAVGPSLPYVYHPIDEDIETDIASESTNDVSRNVYQNHRWRTNRRKRERNLGIKQAFVSLRNCIPNIPENAKVPKIQILQLAASYIAYLTALLNQQQSSDGVRNVGINLGKNKIA